MSLAAVAEEMMDRCLASDSEVGGVGCDNMTVIIIAVLHGQTKEQWYDALKARVAAAAQQQAAIAQRQAEEAEASPSPFELKHTLLSSPSDNGSDGSDKSPLA
jgi:protein phosphatase 2C family protein 2/3